MYKDGLTQILKYLESLNMMNKYEKWYENTDEYSKLEQYIENIFVKLLNINSINREKWIFPYFKTTYSDGTSFMDGNPIFSARAPNEKKIIKIIVDDNYDAIEVSKITDIPMDYQGAMGVPITFMDKYCPVQFDIIGASESEGKGFSNGLWNSESGIAQPLVKGNKKYKRVFIKRK